MAHCFHDRLISSILSGISCIWRMVRMDGNGTWAEVPSTIPVMVFSLVYHDLAPVLCAHLGGNLARLTVSVLLGSIIPLLALLAWDAIALGLSQTDHDIDPIELLTRSRWGGISYMVEAFSLVAVGTSLIGTLLGFSEFFKEQLKHLSSHSHTIQTFKKPAGKFFGQRHWYRRNEISLTAMGPWRWLSARLSSSRQLFRMHSRLPRTLREVTL